MKHLVKYRNFYDDINVNYEYQFRDIDNGIWYKRKIGTDIWSFTTEEDFNKNSTKTNIIEWRGNI